MYFPENRIIKNLYTNGYEYSYKLDNTMYVGYYCKTFDGKYYVEKDNNIQNIELIKYVDDNININDIDLPLSKFDINNASYEYINLTNNNDSKIIPYNVINLPGKEEYNKGYFYRYILKKANEDIFIEVDEEMYNNINNKNKKYLYELYIPIKIKWLLTGDINDVYYKNKSEVLLNEKLNKLVNLNYFFKKDFVKFYKK